MLRILSLLGYLNPFYWLSPSKETIPESKVRKLDPLNFGKYPELRELQQLGAGPSKLRECQIGLEYFKEKGLGSRLDELKEAYITLLKANGCTPQHIALFNNMITNCIIDKIEFNLYEISDFLAGHIENGKSYFDIYKLFVPQAKIEPFPRNGAGSYSEENS